MWYGLVWPSNAYCTVEERSIQGREGRKEGAAAAAAVASQGEVVVVVVVACY